MSSIINDQILQPPVRAMGTLRISIGLVALLAAGMLVYVSGSFLVAEVLGIKRFLQVVLVLVLVAGAAIYGMQAQVRRIDPLVAFVVLMLGTEIVLRGEPIYIVDAFSALLGLIVILSVPEPAFWRGARFVVWLSAIFAFMALVQWLLLFLYTDLGAYRMVVNEDGSIDSAVRHPIALLGLFGEQQYALLGRPVARLQSFAREPSLNVIYFMVPAALAMLVPRRRYFTLGVFIALYSVLSLSGSVFLSLTFMALWWCLLHLVTFRFAFTIGLLTLLAGYIVVLKRIGSEALIAGTIVLAQYGDFFSKSSSITDRGIGATENLSAALGQPLGSGTLPDMAGPWLINGALAAGWLGALCIFLLLLRFGRLVDRLDAGSGALSRVHLGNVFLLGTISTLIVFNDYQMSHYAGLALLGFVGRALQLRADARARAEQPSA